MGCKASKLIMGGAAAGTGEKATLNKIGCFGWGLAPPGAGEQVEICTHAASPETRRAGPPPFAEKQMGSGHWSSDTWALPGRPSGPSGDSQSSFTSVDIDHYRLRQPPILSSQPKVPADDNDLASPATGPTQIHLVYRTAGAGGCEKEKGKGGMDAPAASAMTCEHCTLKVKTDEHRDAIVIEWEQKGFGKTIRRAINNAANNHHSLRSGEIVPVIITSPAFKIASLPGFTWRMLWSIKDWSEDALSLYLQCSTPGWAPGGSHRHAPGGSEETDSAGDPEAPAVSGGQDADAMCGEAGRSPTVTEGVEITCKFLFGCSAARTSPSLGSTSATKPSLPPSGADAGSSVGGGGGGSSAGSMIDFDFKHTFTPWDSVWGVQEMLSFRNTDELELQFPEMSTMHVTLELCNPIPKTISNVSPPAKLICHSPRMIGTVLICFSDASRYAADSAHDRERTHHLECRSLMELAGPDLRRSRVTNGRVIENRTSYSTFLTGEKERDARILAIEEKIGTLMRNTPLIRTQTCLGSTQARLLSSAEPLQVVRYNHGEYYRDHFDNKEGVAVIKRAATLIMYLTDVEEGGATYFPKACIVDRAGTSSRGGSRGNLGIRVLPRQGDALLFWNIGVDGREECNSVHAAEPVVEGQKWICTKWLKLT